MPGFISKKPIDSHENGCWIPMLLSARSAAYDKIELKCWHLVSHCLASFRKFDLARCPDLAKLAPPAVQSPSGLRSYEK